MFNKREINPFYIYLSNEGKVRKAGSKKWASFSSRSSAITCCTLTFVICEDSASECERYEITVEQIELRTQIRKRRTWASQPTVPLYQTFERKTERLDWNRAVKGIPVRTQRYASIAAVSIDLRIVHFKWNFKRFMMWKKAHSFDIPVKIWLPWVLNKIAMSPI